MWVMLSNAFFSIVDKDCDFGELMVRARRPGDLEKVFPSTRGKVQEFTTSDYHYRCAISRDEIKAVMCDQIDRIDYSNFKKTVKDDPLHRAYLRVWHAMADLQPQEPYAGRMRFFRREQTAMTFDDETGTIYDTGLSPEESAHVFATGHMPEDLVDVEILSGHGAKRTGALPKSKRAQRRSLKKGR
jgi:hypothetical protein